MARKKKVATGK